MLAEVDHSMRCMTEETFGPTLPVMRVRDADEAVALANEGPYGLQASVWTRDEVRGEEIARRIEAGVACVNDAQLNYAALELPMGGWKASGLGSRHGADGIRKYTKRQSLMIVPGSAPSRDAHHFPYSAQVTEAVGEVFAALATSELFTDAQRATLIGALRHLHPGARGARGRRGAGRRSGPARRRTSAPPRGSRSRCCRPGSPRCRSPGCGRCSTRSPTQGMAASTPQEAREAIVHAFSEDPEALAGIATLRGLTGSVFYALPDLGTGRNPTWDEIGFPGPPAPPAADRERPLRVRRPAGADEVVEADVCIVGSGAGGGVIAGELAAAGKSVVVLEAGDYFDDSDFDGLELNAYQRSYLNGGPFPTVDGQVSIVTGTGVGGGTVVNWTNCLRTYDHVRAEWAGEHGLSDLAESDFDRHLDAVFERLEVNDECSDLNGPHQRMREGCEKLGYEFELITRNANRDRYTPEAAAYMGFGDPSGSKNSTAKTYLVDAQAGGAEIFVGAAASRVIVEDGRAAGVEAVWSDPAPPAANGAGAHTLTVRAPVVVAAAGSINSPALLLRSGIGGPAVGDYLRLHPTVVVTAYYDEPQNWMWGPPQAGLSHQFADTGDGYGFLIECAQATTGLFAGASPWRSGADHKRRMREWEYAAPFIGVTREHGHGRVEIDAAGNPLVHYPIADEVDVRNLRLALEQLSRVHEAAGAREIVGSGMRAPDWKRGDDFEALRRRVERIGDRPARVRHLLGAPDGELPDGPRPGDVGRQPVGRAPRHARRLDRRRERVPERLGDEPDGDDHGAGAADGARDRWLASLSAMEFGPEQKAPVNGIEIAYQEMGDPDGELVVLVMGLGTQMIAWDPGVLLAARRARLPRRPLRQPRRRALDLDRRAGAGPGPDDARAPQRARLLARRHGRRPRRAGRSPRLRLGPPRRHRPRAG